VPLLGAGMSVACGLPSGGALADWMRNLPLASHVDFSPVPSDKTRNPLWISQQILVRDPSLRPALQEAVADHLRQLEAKATPSPALLSLARTPNRPALILTLNYDRLVQRPRLR